MSAWSTLFGNSLCLPIIMTTQRINLLMPCQTPQKLYGTPGKPRESPTVP